MDRSVGGMKEPMSHITKIVETQQVSDGAISVRIRCCDNPKSDSTLTVYIAGLSDEMVKSKIDKHHDKVAAACAAMAKGKHLLDGLVKKPVTHGGK